MPTRFITKGKGKDAKHIPLSKRKGVSRSSFNNNPSKMKSSYKVPTLPNDPVKFDTDEDTLIEMDSLGTVNGEPVIANIRDFSGKRSKHKVTIKIDLRRENKSQKGVDGREYQDPFVLGISSSIWQRDESDILSGGQNQDTLREAFEEGKLEIGSGITDDEFERLLDIWDRWHLNDLKAGTARQNKIIEEHENDLVYKNIDDHYDKVKTILKDFDADPDTETEGFGEDGYEYGSAWLFEPLPDDVIEFVERIKNKLPIEDDE